MWPGHLGGGTNRYAGKSAVGLVSWRASGPHSGLQPLRAGQEELLGLLLCSELPSSSEHPPQASVRHPSPPAGCSDLDGLNLIPGIKAELQTPSGPPSWTSESPMQTRLQDIPESLNLTPKESPKLYPDHSHHGMLGGGGCGP